jgi:hypothetical protein
MTDQQMLFWIQGFLAGKKELNAEDTEQLRQAVCEHNNPKKDLSAPTPRPDIFEGMGLTKPVFPKFSEKSLGSF